MKAILSWLLAFSLVSAFAEARITRLEITGVIPEPDGYQRILGRAFGEVDPNHPRNRIIQDIELAPRNQRGAVEYSMDFTILKPTGSGNGLLFHEAVNVGFALTELPGFFASLGALARARGYTIVFSGNQDNLIPFAPIQHTLQTPVATRKGETITGPARVQLRPTQTVLTLPISGTTLVPEAGYEPADLLDHEARLIRRRQRDEGAEKVPREDWAFATCSDDAPFPGIPSTAFVCVRNGFDPTFIYELVYAARNPRVSGLGFAATRDLVSYLRNDGSQDNPIAGATRAAVLLGISRSSDFARQFLHLGFNEDEAGRMVFQGMNAHIEPLRIASNIRFWTPMPPWQDAPYRPGNEFPFTYQSVHDPLTRDTGTLFGRCARSRSCPKVMETLTSTEYWQSHASLTTTDPLGKWDLPTPESVRFYLFSSAQHVPAAPGQSSGLCRYPVNTNDYRPNHLALIVALEQWVLEGRHPPKSEVPLLEKRTLVKPERLRWPDVPAVEFTALHNDLPLVTFGRHFDAEDVTGILRLPNVLPGRRYGVRVPEVDADGNELAGIRSTTIQAPLGTYTGWNLKDASLGEDRLCDLDGSFVPFAETRAEREAAGDPRLSLEERYGDHEGYVAAVRAAAEKLVAERFLLPEDAERAIAAAEASDVLRP